MENDYISREEAKSELLTEATIINDRRFMKTDSAIAVLDLIPAADVVEVIRCRDCKYFVSEKCVCRYCYYGGEINENDFCSRAERKENET